MADRKALGDPSPYDAFRPGRWRARWIWCEVPAIRSGDALGFDRRISGGGRFACLRRRFALECVPHVAPARMTADARYALWVNGGLVSRGPVRANARVLHYDAIDLAPHLQAGENSLAVLARVYGSANPWWAPAPATHQLGAGAFVLEARLADGAWSEGEWLVSDAGWRALPGDAWQEVRGQGISSMPIECFDGRLLDPRWRETDFDDSDDAGWRPATVLAANSIGFSGRHEPPSQPYGALLPRPIPQLAGETRYAEWITERSGPATDAVADPVEQVRLDARAAIDAADPAAAREAEIVAEPGRSRVLVFDFGEVVAGGVALELEAVAGTRIDVATGELLTSDGRVDLREQHSGFRVVARGDRVEGFESFDAFGLRYAALAVRGRGRVSIRSLAVRERLHPREPGPPFRCSDPLLEKIWAVGRRTVDLCSHDAYLDCPTREQRAWTGDFVVHQKVDLTTNADWRLPRWNLELTASPRPDGMLPMAAAGDIEDSGGTFIPDWALHWVRALYDLYRYAGDAGAVSRLLPVAENVLRWFAPYQAEDGLLVDVTGWLIADWSSLRTDGRSSILNALFGRALRDFAEMSAWVGDAGRARWARAALARVAKGFEAFWDPDRRVYVDQIEEGERRPALSQHAQATAICAGLVPADRLARLIDVVTDSHRRVHATWSRATGDSRRPKEGESGVGGPYLLTGPPAPWWHVENQVVAAQPFYRYVLHEAFALAGRADLVVASCRDWAALLERCSTSWSETWFGGTTCHGWCSTPTADLLTYTLGVTPAEPGYARARVAPRLADLQRAAGAVPTPAGWLRCEVEARGDFSLDSPVPMTLELEGEPARELAAGRHKFRA